MKDKWVKLSTVKDVLMRYSPPESKHAKYFSEFLVERIEEETPAINAIIIPEVATNGDVIKIMFEVAGYTPIRNGLTDKDGYYVHIKGYSTHEVNFVVSLDWWNTPYNQEGMTE